MALVSSMVNTGQGYSQLEEFSATMYMPNMSNKLYQAIKLFGVEINAHCWTRRSEISD